MKKDVMAVMAIFSVDRVIKSFSDYFGSNHGGILWGGI